MDHCKYSIIKKSIMKFTNNFNVYFNVQIITFIHVLFWSQYNQSVFLFGIFIWIFFFFLINTFVFINVFMILYKFVDWQNWCQLDVISKWQMGLSKGSSAMLLLYTFLITKRTICSSNLYKIVNSLILCNMIITINRSINCY